MNRILLLLLLSVYGMAGAAEPFVKFPEKNGKWTILFSESSNKNAPQQTADSKITKAEVIRKSGLRLTRIWWSAGRVSEVWTIESARVRVFESPANGAVYVVPFNDSTMTSFIPRDFDESLFSWLAPQYSEAAAKFKGRDSLVYAGEIAPVFAVPGLTQKPENLPPRPHKAWIDASNLQPIALDNGISLLEFQFDTAPADTPIMPDRMRSELERYLKDLTPSKRLERVRARSAQYR